MSGMEGRESWSKLCSLGVVQLGWGWGGGGSTPVLILECDM